MTPRLQTILAELRAALEVLYGERLERLVLYGSQARGDAAPDSDIDVLVVLRGELDVDAELDRISYVTADLTVKHGTLISAVVVSEQDLALRRRPMLREVEREGIRI